MLISPTDGQGFRQFMELGTAFLVSGAIVLEREIRQKSAGLRTYTIVGASAALLMLISRYGFANVLENGLVVLDPSRVAAQIVSGIGFIGAGVIFVRRDRAAGLFQLALAATLACFVVALVFPLLVRRLTGTVPTEQVHGSERE
jgi:putative Mg2+ transporter-C (MgtC) family protein